MQKMYLYFCLGTIVLAIFLVILSRFSPQTSPQSLQNFEPYRGSLSGEVVCLPHADQDGPQTLECATGLKADTGEYYALDSSLSSQELAPFETGERISGNGLITPVENLSSDHWKKYAIKGIFSVTDSVQKL